MLLSIALALVIPFSNSIYLYPESSVGIIGCFVTIAKNILLPQSSSLKLNAAALMQQMIHPFATGVQLAELGDNRSVGCYLP